MLHAVTSTLHSDQSYKYEGPRLAHAVRACAKALCMALKLKMWWLFYFSHSNISFLFLHYFLDGDDNYYFLVVLIPMVHIFYF